MPYYCFNRCPKNAGTKIESLANELGLKEIECYPPSREWIGEAFKRRIKFDREVILVYGRSKKYPVMFQTATPVTHRQKDVKSLLQKLMNITKTTQIYDCFEPYDMNEFR